ASSFRAALPGKLLSCWTVIRSSLRRFQFQKNGSIVPDLWEFVWDYERCYQMTDRKLLSSLVSAAGFEPATHALKGSPTQSQTTTCTSSLLHARHNKVNEMPTRHRSGCPEGARNPASRTMSLRFAGSFV